MAPKQFYEDFPATAFLLLLNLGFFCLELIVHSKAFGEMPMLTLEGGPNVEILHRLGSLSLEDLRQGEYWRILSATFLHGGFVHILMNGFVLLDLGRSSEPFLSSWRFLVVYVSSAVGGSLGSVGYTAVFSRGALHASRATVGASGALCGLVGLLLIHAIKEGFTERRDLLLRWIALIIFSSFLLGSIDHAAHLGGFAVGCAFGLGVGSYTTSRAAARWKYPGYLAALSLVGSLGYTLFHYFVPR